MGIILLAWLLIPPIGKSWLKISFFEMHAPSIVAVSYLRDVQNYWALRSRGKTELIEEIRDMARLNAAYEARLQKDEIMRRDLLALEQALGIPPRPEYHYETARVARRDINGWWQQLIVRKGSIHGIREGLPVIFAGGVVGRVREVYTHAAVVDLISSESVRLSAIIEGDPRPVGFRGGINPPIRPASGIVEFVPLDIAAGGELPRRLLTSGLGGVFPGGLLIGEIVELEPGADGLFQTGRVRLDHRLNNLTEVTILIPIEPAE